MVFFMAWPENVDKSQLTITCSRGSGPGGQKRNKTSSKVRIVHVPTGLSAESDETRSQHENRRLAFRKLAALLVPIMKNEARKSRYLASKERIRTYHEPDDRVTDDRCEGTWSYEQVIDGRGFGEIVEALVHKKSTDID